MVVKSKFKQTNYFCNCLSRNTLLVSENSVNLLALGIKRVTRNSPTFLTVIQKLQTTKTINYNFFATPEKLKRYCKQK